MIGDMRINKRGKGPRWCLERRLLDVRPSASIRLRSRPRPPPSLPAIILHGYSSSILCRPSVSLHPHHLSRLHSPPGRHAPTSHERDHHFAGRVETHHLGHQPRPFLARTQALQPQLPAPPYTSSGFSFSGVHSLFSNISVSLSP